MTWNPWKLREWVRILMAENARLNQELESSHSNLVGHILKALELRRKIDEADTEFLRMVGARIE